MNEKLKQSLKYLKMHHLLQQGDVYLEEAAKGNPSHSNFLQLILEKESNVQRENARINRITRASIPIKYTFETYPFAKQPHSNRKRLEQHYDSLDYVENHRNVVFIGPTGSGKTGLATAFLVHAVNKGHSGKFITFQDLIGELQRAMADNSTQKVIQKYSKVRCLVIDELGYLEMEKAQAGLFFSLMQHRYKKTCTIITTNLGFKEWDGFFQNPHLTMALVDRLTDNGHIINLKKCVSLRKEAEVD